MDNTYEVNNDYSVSQELVDKVKDKIFEVPDNFNKLIEAVIDKLIDKEPEVSSLITSILFKKIESSTDFDSTIRMVVDKIADDEFKNNILGLLNSRICILESKISELSSSIYMIQERLRDVSFNDGEIIYRTNNTYYGEDVKFTSTYSLSNMLSEIDCLIRDVDYLKNIIEYEQE